jgi:FKBP-type peptidyl-prolyl cis-trans isomerase SlyD
MTITKNSVITLDYRIYDEEGNLVDEGKEPLIYLHGGYGNLFAPLEAALEGKRIGEDFKVALTSEESFGEYQEEMVVTEALSDLPEDLEVGMEIEGYLESAPDDVVIFTVSEITSDEAVLDANHPLTGMNLVFEGTVKAIRAATQKEIKAGRP